MIMPKTYKEDPDTLNIIFFLWTLLSQNVASSLQAFKIIIIELLAILSVIIKLDKVFKESWAHAHKHLDKVSQKSNADINK